MLGGSWEDGLTERQRQLWPGVQSQGLMKTATFAKNEYRPVGIRSGVLADPEFLARIRAVEQQRGVPPGYIHAIIAKESTGNPQAISPADKAGLHGWGLGQFRNATAQNLTKQTGIPIWKDGRVNMDPDVQINAMAELLKAKKIGRAHV